MWVITVLRNVVNFKPDSVEPHTKSCLLHNRKNTLFYDDIENKDYSAFVGTVQYFTFLGTVCVLWNKIVRGCCVITTSNKNGYKKAVWALLSVGIVNSMYKVVQIWAGLIAACLHTNQSRSYLNHLVCMHVLCSHSFCLQSLFGCCDITMEGKQFRLADKILGTNFQGI